MGGECTVRLMLLIGDKVTMSVVEMGQTIVVSSPRQPGESPQPGMSSGAGQK